MRQERRAVLVVALLASGVALGQGGNPSPSTVALTHALERMPLYFIENCGQVDSRVAYYVQGRDTTLYFTAEGMTLVQTEQRHDRNDSTGRLEKASLRSRHSRTPGPGSRWVVKLDFVGANPNPQDRGRGSDARRRQLLQGAARELEDRPHDVRLDRLLRSLAGHRSRLLRDGQPPQVHVPRQAGGRPGPDQAGLPRRHGDQADRRRAARGGDAGGSAPRRPAVRLSGGRGPPRGDRRRRTRSIERRPDGSRGYGFALGPYDRSRPLVLDPAVLVYAGYIGGSGADEGAGIAVDAPATPTSRAGPPSTEATFPVTVGPDLTFNGSGLFGRRLRGQGQGRRHRARLLRLHRRQRRRSGLRHRRGQRGQRLRHGLHRTRPRPLSR